MNKSKMLEIAGRLNEDKKDADKSVCVNTTTESIIINNVSHCYIKNEGTSICFYSNKKALNSIDLKDIKLISIDLGDECFIVID